MSDLALVFGPFLKSLTYLVTLTSAVFNISAAGMYHNLSCNNSVEN